MEQRRVRVNFIKLSKGEDTWETEKTSDVGTRTLQEISIDADDFEVFYEYLDTEDGEERLFSLLEDLLPLTDTTDIMKNVRASSERGSIIE